MEPINLNCRFCGIKTGDFIPPENGNIDDLNPIDIRCSLCEGLYGNFKEMELEYERENGRDFDGFINYMKENDWKRVII